MIFCYALLHAQQQGSRVGQQRLQKTFFNLSFFLFSYFTTQLRQVSRVRQKRLQKRGRVLPACGGSAGSKMSSNKMSSSKICRKMSRSKMSSCKMSSKIGAKAGASYERAVEVQVVK